jgi:hypothetical protein
VRARAAEQPRRHLHPAERLVERDAPGEEQRQRHAAFLHARDRAAQELGGEALAARGRVRGDAADAAEQDPLVPQADRPLEDLNARDRPIAPAGQQEVRVRERGVEVHVALEQLAQRNACSSRSSTASRSERASGGSPSRRS